MPKFEDTHLCILNIKLRLTYKNLDMFARKKDITNSHRNHIIKCYIRCGLKHLYSLLKNHLCVNSQTVIYLCFKKISEKTDSRVHFTDKFLSFKVDNYFPEIIRSFFKSREAFEHSGNLGLVEIKVFS